MEIKLKKMGEEESEQWDKLVYSSSYGTLFHTWKWLKIIEKYSGSKLYPVIAIKDGLVFAIYPIFIIRKFFANFAFSPPLAYTTYLGPLIFDENFKQDKKESIFLELQKEIDNLLFSELKCKYVRIQSPPGLFDARPFRWCGYKVVPQYTYRVNLTKGIESVWDRLDRKLRVDINKATREGVSIEEGNLDDLDFVVNSVHERFKNQGLKITRNTEYLYELYKEFNPENMKIFIARYKGERVGGMVTPIYKNVMYLWEGVSKAGLKGISPNDMVQWEAIKWACNNGYNYYENTTGDAVATGLRSSKSKYNPELVIWFTATKYSSYFYEKLESFAKIYYNTIPKISQKLVSKKRD